LTRGVCCTRCAASLISYATGGGFAGAIPGKLTLLPCLHDRYEEGGTTKSEYFWQDLLVARWIHAARPQKHVDVGSRVDGFVGHVASFREVEVFDIRPNTTQIPGVVFKQVDFMGEVLLPSVGDGYCDSLSCLHAIEHFGLGRYGDRIDPQGYERGITNMAKILKPDGRFYLSTPIGKERVEFNAHRLFDPRTIIRCAESSGLKLEKLTVIGATGMVNQVQPDSNALEELAKSSYNLGIFVFIKRGY
jgi:SAM-dependent methyltransferase